MKNIISAIFTVLLSATFYSQAGFVGINTSEPHNTLEVKSVTPETSGLRFTNLNSSSVTSVGQALGVDSNGDVVTIPNNGQVYTKKVFTLTDTYILAHPSQRVSADPSMVSNLLTLDGLQMDLLLYSAAQYGPQIRNITGSSVRLQYTSQAENNSLGGSASGSITLANNSNFALTSNGVDYVLPTNMRVTMTVNDTRMYEFIWFCYTLPGGPPTKYIFMRAQRIF